MNPPTNESVRRSILSHYDVTNKHIAPLPGNVRQQVHIEYKCPCVETTKFYETQLEQLTSKVRMESDCAGSQEPRLGLCKNPKSKLTLSCHDETTLEVVVTVRVVFKQRKCMK